MLLFLILFFLCRVSFLSFSAGCNKMWFFLCKWVTHLQAEASAFSKLLHTTAPTDFVQGIWISIFWE